MRSVIGSIHHFSRMIISNVFLLDGGPGDRWLVDSGHWSERVTLLWELRRAGMRPDDLTGVLLTHRHSDHAGNAAFLQRHGVKVYAHRRDADVLAGAAPRPWLGTRAGGTTLALLLAQFENFAPAARLHVDRALDDGDAIAGLEVHWMPGHTEGSVFYRHEPTRSLFSGDMLLAALPPLTIVQRMAMPYPTFTTDMARALDSLRAFHHRAIPYDNLLAGHGRPILGGARDTALRLIDGTAPRHG